MSDIRHGARQNARTWGQNFSARLLEPGLVSYEDCGGGKELLTAETINAYAQTFVGKPVVIQHQGVSPENQDRVAVGHISRVWNEASDGWTWCEGVIFKDEAKDLIKDGWFVSSAYHVKNTAPGGTHHNIPYVSETIDFEGEHLAIVERPRYENATIRLNSKPNDKNMSLIKWFKDLVTPEAKELSAETEISAGGKSVRLNDLVASYKADKEKRSNEVALDSFVDVDGEKVAIKDLIASHERLNTVVDDKGGRKGLVKVKKKKSNGEEETDEEAETRENAESAAKAGKDKDAESERQNGLGLFRTLQDAKNTGSFDPISGGVQSAGTLTDRCQTGNSRYGSDPVKK